MFHIRLFDTDTFLELVPRWGEAPAWLDVGRWLLVGVVPMGLVFWLYLYEIKLVRSVVAGSLLLLRLLVLSLLVFLVLWQPSFAQQAPPKEKVPERVVVLIDRTGSMDVADPERSAVEKLRLVRALKLRPKSDDNRLLSIDAKLLDSWIATSGDKKDPQWIAANEIVDDPVARQRLEAERRELHRQLCNYVDQQTRTRLVERLLDPEGGRLLHDLEGRFQVQVLGFSNDVVEVTPDRWTDLFPAKERPAEERAFTDLAAPLENAIKKALTGGPVRAVILLSDGRHNKGEFPGKVAVRLGEEGKVPLFPVVVGSKAERPGITVTNIVAPTTILMDPEDAKNLNALVKTTVKVRAVDAQPLVVELYDGKKLLGRKTLKHVGGDHDYELVFPTALSDEGTHTLLVKVPLPADLKEKLKQKDGLERTTEIHVVKDQADVLVIDGEMRWESHYLTVALGRDKLVKEVRGVVFEQPRVGKVQEDELRKMNAPALKLPEEAAALTAYDCIILGDVPPDQLPLKDRERLQSYVRDAGGTLVIVAGKRSMPLAYPKELPDEPNRTDPITAMLPITLPQVVQSRDGFPITLTDDGKLNPLLQLSDKKSDDEVGVEGRPERNIWEELPPHYWAVVGKKKATATTLAFYPGEVDERGERKELKKTEQEGRSLIAWQSYGRGRVLFVGVDSTWRWRYKVGDQHHHRFWGQLIRWATSDKLLPGGAGKVRFGTPRPTYEPGEEIEVRVRLDKSLPEPGAKDSIVANILRVDGDKKEKVSALTLLPRTGQPRTLEGKLRDLPAGSYRVELDFGDLTPKLGADVDVKALNEKGSTFVIVAPPNEEMTDVTADPGALQQLAILSRPELKKLVTEEERKKAVKVYTPDNAREILDLLERHDVEEEPIVAGQALWEWWPTLVMILGLLTVEWVARKWSGLP